MKIKYNNQQIEIDDKLMLSTFVFSQIGEKTNGIAVAVNNSVIPKTNWEVVEIQPNDNILLIKATQGG
jgi:sulfur carrier protein